MINKFDTPKLMTESFWECKERVGRLGITNLVKAYDYIYMLSELIDPNNEILDDLHDVIKPLAETIKECETKKVCPFCGNELYLSDLPQYDYVCVNCDENFYECEVK
jgi:hypothetical protein